ncbi:hypothetical protein DFH94DRAFT_689006 [Russula ochroleuca]|uniref:Uncharacterized protein n=1 Tax=Russula ochroleuca TaxID=152965 RepID=A0A9P5TBY5_9AGAM|nr:hypothetical protein DFH94DRAFT_689006 [Russula ochroleuca]
MSLKRYFSQLPSSADQSAQKKAKQSQVNLPAIDNDLLPLLDLSSPSLSSHASVIRHFDTIAEHLFQRSYIVCCSTKRDGGPKRVLYELLEFEFYLIKPDCHSDPFTHDGEDQRLSGAWYFHRVPRFKATTTSGPPAYRSGSRKGLDLTIGTPNSPDSSNTQPVPVRGGILLRTLRRVSDSTVISGPSLLVDELLRTSGAADIPELVNEKWMGDISAFRAPSTGDPHSNPVTLFVGVKEEAPRAPPQMYKSPRIGLDLSHPSTRLDPSDRRVRYVSKPYRYFILPHLLTANGRGQTFLGVHDHCVNALQISKKPSLVGKITSLTGMQSQTVDKYLNTYREALASGELERFIGSRGKGASASPGTFLQLMGALQRRELVE